MFDANFLTSISYVPSSASWVASADNTRVFDEVAIFLANTSIVAILKRVSVTFSNNERNDEKNDFILFNVFKEVVTTSFFSCSVVTFALFNAVSDSTHDDVSKPDAKPLNDIDITSPTLFVPSYKIANATGVRGGTNSVGL